MSRPLRTYSEFLEFETETVEHLRTRFPDYVFAIGATGQGPKMEDLLVYSGDVHIHYHNPPDSWEVTQPFFAMGTFPDLESVIQALQAMLPRLDRYMCLTPEVRFQRARITIYLSQHPRLGAHAAIAALPHELLADIVTKMQP